MKSYQVRKGHLVYFQNELHRVYSVKKMLKPSFHLVRLKDFEQHLAKAREITYYRPKPLDSFVFNRKRYTLYHDRRPTEGDLILINKPRPDYMDQYGLNQIAKVVNLEEDGIVTHKGDGVKHNEYLLMVLDKEDRCRDTACQSQNESAEKEEPAIFNEDFLFGTVHEPQPGDIYVNKDRDETAIVIATEDQQVFLGNGLQLSKKELADSKSWTYDHGISHA